jgi:hypothetical protein
MDNQQIDVKFMAMNDHEARILIKNNTGQPLNLKMPEAFAGVPVLAQFGGGGGGRVGGGGRSVTTGGGNQSVGGGGGGLGGGGLGGGGGGGGFFSIPPEKITKIDVPVVCLDHGLRDPHSAAAYKIVPAESHVGQPAVVELLKAFGRGQLEHGAAQAAAWHLNSGLSWQELSAKLTGTRRSLSRSSYFSPAEIRAGMAYAGEAARLAEVNAEQYAKEKQARLEKADAPRAEVESSDERSTTDADSNEIAPAADQDDSAPAEEAAPAETTP